MNLHLREIARAVAPGLMPYSCSTAPAGTPATLSSRHTTSRFSACLHSPELNPVENVWEYLRKNNLALRVYETYDAIVDACCNAWIEPHRDARHSRINHPAAMGKPCL